MKPTVSVTLTAPEKNTCQHLRTLHVHLFYVPNNHCTRLNAINVFSINADLKQVGDDYGFDAADARVKRAQHADGYHGHDLRHAGDRVQSQRGRVQHQSGAKHCLHAERH